MISSIIFLAILLVLIAWIVGIPNRLVSFRICFKNAFAQIDVRLERRYDLTPIWWKPPRAT